tara:strand:+ start:4274 stop:4552 length:279 start_codon:yes stop_codon:yes gene_type:complete
MDLMFIKSTLRSNYTSLQNRMTTLSTMARQQQDSRHLLKGVIDIFFTSCRGLIAITIALTILLVDSLMVAMFGLVILLEKLLAKIMPDGEKE